MITVDGRIAGFVLLQELFEDGKPLFDIGEFFIAGKFQRKGVGRQITHELFKRFRGNWRIRQIPENTPAVNFWRKTIGEYSHENFKENQTEEAITQTFMIT